MTECTQESFEFESHVSCQVVAPCDSGVTISDGGALLPGEAGRLIERLAACFDDDRDPLLVRRPVEEMLAQWVSALALGYEDLNDHDPWPEDPLPALPSGKNQVGTAPRSGKNTLNRPELGGEPPRRKCHAERLLAGGALVS